MFLFVKDYQVFIKLGIILVRFCFLKKSKNQSYIKFGIIKNIIIPSLDQNPLELLSHRVLLIRTLH